MSFVFPSKNSFFFREVVETPQDTTLRNKLVGQPLYRSRRLFFGAVTVVIDRIFSTGELQQPDLGTDSSYRGLTTPLGLYSLYDNKDLITR